MSSENAMLFSFHVCDGRLAHIIANSYLEALGSLLAMLPIKGEGGQPVALIPYIMLEWVEDLQKQHAATQMQQNSIQEALYV